jgi:hypothetical protein
MLLCALDRVLEYLNTGETLAFVGAGVSRELGIPTWGELGELLVSRVPPHLGKRREEAERLLDKKRYPELCQWIAGNVSEDFLYSSCREILKDPGATGRICKFIAKFPFKSVFTTNFDDSLRRHFEAEGKAVAVFLNTQEDLATVDIDTIPCIVKLHSDLDHRDTLVLTESQYSRVRTAGPFEYLREFVRSYFVTKRFLIVGYSLSDPDIQLLLEQVAQNLRRKEPIYAIIADAQPEERARLKTLYNVEVISYRNRSGTHRELVSLFEALSAFVAEGPPRRPDAPLDLKRAQSLYLWSRFSLSGDSRTAHIDSLKSVILFELDQVPQSLSELQNSVGVYVGLTGPVLADAVRDAVADLQRTGCVESDDGTLRLTSKSTGLVTTASKQHGRLRESFIEQTRLDLESRWPDTSRAEREKAIDLALNVLVEVFDERGVEIVNSVFGGVAAGGRRSASLFSTLARAGRDMGTDDLCYRFVSYMADLITSPQNAQRAYLEHLAIAFFSINALAMDPEGHRFRKEFLSGRKLIVDSNILIPVLPLSGTFQSDVANLLMLARENRMPLMTTEGFILEVFRHGRWAADLVDIHGPTSYQVLQAARGEGYKRNAFLDGFIRYSVDERTRTFDSYLRECIGGMEFSRETIIEYLERQFGISLFPFGTLASKRQTVFLDRDQTEDFIRQQAEEHLIDKGDSRVRAEAEAYAIVSNWDAMNGKASALGTGDEAWDAAVLSQGGFLNRIARFGPRPIGRHIVVSPDALYGFLLRSGAVPQGGLSFRELVVSPLFDTSVHFVDKERYRKFFSHLINDADRIYREHLETFQAKVDSSLKPEFFDDVDPLDRPYFLSSLQTRLESTVVEMGAREKELAAGLAEAERKLKKQEKLLRSVAAVKARKARKKEAQKPKRKKRRGKKR